MMQRLSTLKFVCPWLVLCGVGLLWSGSNISAQEANEQSPVEQAISACFQRTFVSTADGSSQPFLEGVPKNDTDQPRPVLIFLHSWSGNYRQNNLKWEREALARGWIFLHPDFRGANLHPEACGSPLARQDILDCLEDAQARHAIDPERIYLAGASGGGHMSMLMAGHHPDRFSAVSAWVGISDLAEWYHFHTKQGVPQNYAKMIVKSLGGAPGGSAEIDARYHDRSPIHQLQRAAGLPIEVNAGIYDGHRGSVPITHTLLAFNVLAKANGGEPVDEATIARLIAQGRKIRTAEKPQEIIPTGDVPRQIHLERQAGAARTVIFEGGHEGLPKPACDWLAQQRRLTKK